MDIRVTIDDREMRRAIKGLEEHLRGTRTIHIIVGRALRDYARETITLGGRGKWPPLAQWTQRRTGRSLPLRGTQRLITYEADRNGATVFARKPMSGEWDLDMHARGYRTPARVPQSGMAMRIPLKGEAPAFLKRARPSIIPARPFLPERAQIIDIVRPKVEQWVAEGARRKWR